MSKLKDAMNQEMPESDFPDPEYDNPPTRLTEIQGISPSPGKLGLALAKAQSELQNVEKKHEGYQNRYRFADLGAVLDVIRPVFSKHGLAFTQLVGDAPDGRVSLTTMLLHESGQTLQTTSSMAIHKMQGMSDAQAAGSVITYLRRYQITAMAGIAQEDTDAAIEEKPKRQKRQHAPSEDFQKPLPDPDKIRAILSCEDLQTLAEMWGKFDKSEHKLYNGVKEQRKAELQALEADEQQKAL